MPSVSQDQQQMTAIALKHPEKLYVRNRGVLKMKKSQLHEFAATRSKGLPARAKR